MNGEFAPEPHAPEYFDCDDEYVEETCECGARCGERCTFGKYVQPEKDEQ